MTATTKARDPSGRDLVFEDWFKANIKAEAGGALEQRSIYRAYRQYQRGDRALGEQGVERMLNKLNVAREVRQGKTYRVGVAFAVVPLVDAENLPPPEKLPPPSVTLREASSPMVEGLTAGVALANAPREVFSAAMSIACEVAEERIRQQAPTSQGGEGYDLAHDDASDPGAHERAAACYAYAAGQAEHVAGFVDFNVKSAGPGRLGWVVRDTIVMMWPWSVRFWKPKTDAPDWRRRCLVIAGALILAAIERHDRDKARKALADSQASQMTGV